MEKKNILVTTVGGLTSPDLLKAMRENGEIDFFVLGTDAFEFAVGKNFVDVFEVSPNSAKDEEGFVDFLNEMVEKYNIDLIYPCGNEDNLALAKYIDKVKVKVVVGDYEDLIRAYDKGEVYEVLAKELPQNAPKFKIVSNYNDFFDAVKELGYPNKKVAVKPRFGKGGRGVYILSDFISGDVFSVKPSNEFPIEFLEKVLPKNEKFEDLIVMEYLQDTYYSAYSLCKDGENIITLTHTREWGNASQTFRGKVYYDTKLEEACAKVIKLFNLSYTLNMEFATADDGRIVLFDLNPRIAASSGIDKEIGLNFPYEAIKIALGEKVNIDKNGFKEPKRFVRYFDQVWM